MAKEKLTLCTLSGPLEKFDFSVQTFVINRQFHPVNTIGHMKGMKALIPFESFNPYDDVLKKIGDIAAELGIKLDYEPFDQDEIDPMTVTEYFEGLSGELTALYEEKDHLSLTIADNHNIIEIVRHLGNISEGMETLFSMKSTKFRFGRMPRLMYDESIQWINSREDTYYIHTSIEEEYVYGMYFALPSAEERVDAFFTALQFERIWIPEKVQGTPEEAAQRLKAEIVSLTGRLGQIETQIKDISTAEKHNFLQFYSYVRFVGEAYSLRAYAGHSHERFYLVGWIPKALANEFSEMVGSCDGLGCILTDVAEMPDTPPPIKRKTGLLTSLYEPYLEMYGLPSYKEFDPGLFLAITYSLFFGIMFGDVGQGILLILFGVLMYKLKGMWLGGILACCGVSATIFGFVYGSVFGYEELLGGFKILEGNNVFNILVISAGIGIGMITLCMLINIYNGILQKDIEKILFEANSVCGLVFFLSVVFGLISSFLFGTNVFSTPYIIFLIVLPLVLIMCKEPLSKLIMRRPDWRPESISALFVEGFFELYETVLSFVSNTLSFLRIGAFAINHAGMMMVVFLLAESPGGGYNPVVLVIGNLFAMGLETMLVCIQLLRLEFYELFGRFYSDGGVKFSPLIIDYKSIYNN